MENPALSAAFGDAMRQAEGESHILRDSENLPQCGCGDVNLFPVFAEKMSQCAAASGRAGCIVPGGMATDDTTKDFFAGLVETKRLVSLPHFENEESVFPSVHHAFRFCLPTRCTPTRRSARSLATGFPPLPLPTICATSGASDGSPAGETSPAREIGTWKFK